MALAMDATAEASFAIAPLRRRDWQAHWQTGQRTGGLDNEHEREACPCLPERVEQRYLTASKRGRSASRFVPSARNPKECGCAVKEPRQGGHITNKQLLGTDTRLRGCLMHLLRLLRFL